MTTRAAIYLRISLDAAMDGPVIERQREDCEAIAKQRGWTVVHTYVDQSISASKKDVARPDYDAMVASYERGELDAIICWDLDRLTRQPSQLEEWIDRAEEHGLKLAAANGDADLSTDGGRMFARIKGP
ncbi:recombinase family protein [Corynebacterium confusum]